MTGFHEVKLGDVLTLQRGFDITKCEQSDGNVPIVSSSGISSYHNTWKVKGPGLIIGRKGTLGTVHLILSNYWPHDTTLWVKDFKGNDPRFLNYFLKTLKLENFDVGASNPTLNRNHVHKIKIIFPTKVDTQKKIAAILSAYDELIENNERRIALVKKLAEEIYREWFVRLRFPSHETTKRIKGLPEDWQNLGILDVAAVRYGKNLPMKMLSDHGQYPVYGAAKVIGYYHEYNYEERTIITGCRGSVGQMNLTVPKVFVTNNSFAILPYHKKSFFWLFHTLRARGFDDVIGGSAQPQITIDGIKSAKLITPPEELRTQFFDLVRPIYDAIWTIEDASALLAKTRDMLLPRLVSGKLSVENLDIQFPPCMAEELNTASFSTADA